MAPWKSESSQVSRRWVYYTNLIIDHEYVYESGHTTHTQTQTGTPDFSFFLFFLWWFTPNLILNPIPKRKGVFSRDSDRGQCSKYYYYLSIYLSIYSHTYTAPSSLLLSVLLKVTYLKSTAYIHNIYNYRRITNIFGTKLSYKTKFTTVHLLISISIYLFLHLSLVTIFINTTTWNRSLSSSHFFSSLLFYSILFCSVLFLSVLLYPSLVCACVVTGTLFHHNVTNRRRTINVNVILCYVLTFALNQYNTIQYNYHHTLTHRSTTHQHTH